MKSALIIAALFACMLYGCSTEPSQEVIDKIAGMESQIANMEKKVSEFKALTDELKSELSDCRDEMQALIQENKIAAIRQSHLVGDSRKGVQVRAYAGQAKDPGIVGVGQQVTRMGREAG